MARVIRHSHIRSLRHDQLPVPGPGRQDAVVPDQVESWRRHKRREFLDQLQRFEHHMRRPVAPVTLETIQQPAIGQQRQTLQRQRRTAGVTALCGPRSYADLRGIPPSLSWFRRYRTPHNCAGPQ